MPVLGRGVGSPLGFPLLVIFPSIMSAPVPTTVLFFDHTAKMGGGEIALFNLVTHLDRRHYDPVVVLAEDGVLRERLSAAGVETHVLPLSSGVTQIRKDSLTGSGNLPWAQVGEMARYVWRLGRFARGRGVHIIHTNSLKADIIGALAGRLGRVPVLWHVRDRIADDYLPSTASRVFRLLCRVLPNHVIVNSAATLDALQLPANYNAHLSNNGIVHDGLPVFPHSPNDAAQTATENAAVPATETAQFAALHTLVTGDANSGDANSDGRVKTDARAPIIGLVGRISPWKGQDVFLRAAALVKERYPDARFQIIGSALFGEEELERELRALCTELGLDENVEWLGFREDIPQLLEQMTILAHASTTGEPFGQVVVEAMMAKRPLVATRGGGIPEIVMDEETGLLVPMKDAPAMARALLRLLDDPQWAKAMGQAGHRRALSHFTIAHTVAKMGRIYADISEEHRLQTRRKRLMLLGATVLLATFAVEKFKRGSRDDG